MNIHITARHFKAHNTLREYAFNAINKLERWYDGILSVKLILSYEKASNSIKAAELIVKVQGSILTSLEKTKDYYKSINAAVAKIEIQLHKHKSRKREKRKTIIRATKAKV